MDNADFVQGIAQLLFYQTENGNMDVPENYVSGDRFPLGEFIREIRADYREGLLKPDQEKRLDEIGFAMDESEQTWKSLYNLAKEYVSSHDGKLPKPMDRTPDTVLIGAWVRKQRLTFHSLESEQQDNLERIGIYASDRSLRTQQRSL